MEFSINRHIVNHKEGITQIIVAYKRPMVHGALIEDEDTITVQRVENWTPAKLRDAVVAEIVKARAAEKAKVSSVEETGAITVTVPDEK